MVFGFGSKKRNLENTDKSETIKEDFTKAKELLVCPVEDEKWNTLSDSRLKDIILGKIVIEGDVIIIENKRKNSALEERYDDFFESDIAEEFGLFREMKLKILKTDPKGKVKITADTTVRQLSGIPNEDGIPMREIINVKKLPEFKRYIEVTELKEITKIARAGDIDSFINRFEDKRKVVYFVNGYYYVKKK